MSEIAAEVTGSNQPGGNEQVDTTGGFSFSDLHEKAMAYQPEGTPSVEPTEQPAQVETTPEVKVEAQAEPENVDNASAAQLAQLKDTDLIEITVDGQQVVMPWKDAKGGFMRQAKFTKEMTSFRQEQAEFQSQLPNIQKLQQDQQVLINLLNNKEMLRDFARRQYPDLFQQAVAGAVQQVQAQAQANGDSGDIATVGQVQAVAQQVEQNIQNLVKGLETALQQRETALVQDIQDRNETLKLSNEINGTIQQMFDAHPNVVKLVPEANEMLRYKVFQMQPKTPEETIQAFKDVFGGWVEQFESVVADTNKTKVVQKAKLASNNVQPPGGAGVQPQPTNFKKTNPMTGKSEVDWSKLHDAAMAYTK